MGIEDWLSLDEFETLCHGCSDDDEECKVFMNAIETFVRSVFGDREELKKEDTRCGANGKVYMSDKMTCKLEYVCHDTDARLVQKINEAEETIELTKEAGKHDVGLPCSSAFVLEYNLQSQPHLTRLKDPLRLPQATFGGSRSGVADDDMTCMLASMTGGEDDEEEEEEAPFDSTHYLICIVTPRGKPIDGHIDMSLWSKVLDVLEACGQEGFYHADLKLNNMVVLQDGSVRLIDWGGGTRCRPGSSAVSSAMVCSLLFQQIHFSFDTPGVDRALAMPHLLVDRVAKVSTDFILKLNEVYESHYIKSANDFTSIKNIIVAWGYARISAIRERFTTYGTAFEVSLNAEKLKEEAVAFAESEPPYAGARDDMDRLVDNMAGLALTSPEVLRTRELVARLLRYLDPDTSETMLAAIAPSANIDHTCTPPWKLWANTHCPLAPRDRVEAGCLADVGGLEGEWCTPTPVEKESGAKLTRAILQKATGLQILYNNQELCRMHPTNSFVDVVIHHSNKLVHLRAPSDDALARAFFDAFVEDVVFRGVLQRRRLTLDAKAAGWSVVPSSFKKLRSRDDSVLHRHPLVVRVVDAKAWIGTRTFQRY